MTQGLVTLFSDRQFAGSSVPLDEGETRFPADFNDSASSVRVASGYCAVLYEHANEFGGYGASVDLLEDCPDLSVYGFDKKTLSVRVFRTEHDGFGWARGAMRDGQFVAGHWERKRARGGSDLNSTVAVVAPPAPPRTAPLPAGEGVVVRDHRGEPTDPANASGGVVVGSRCPIPPYFEVVGGFSDNFDHFKDTTGYDGGWTGFSKRWKNSDIRSNSIVAGFQFKIGPNGGKRWQLPTKPTDPIKFIDFPSGDVNLFFPRSIDQADWFSDLFTHRRGGYSVAIKWNDNLETFGYLSKEFPHGNYSGNHFEHEFADPFGDQPNPIKDIPNFPRDGEWHSILAVIYNDWYRNVAVGSAGSSSLFPTIVLWYSDTPTHNFNEFTFLGMGVDRHNIVNENSDTDPPLLFSIADSNTVVGDNPLFVEHALQIRIDDVPTEQVEIRNVYAANVIYHGPIVPTNPVVCIPEAKAVSDAQVRIDDLLKQATEARKKIRSPGGGGFSTDNPWLQILNNIMDTELPNARSNLSRAKFIYEKCRKEHASEEKILISKDLTFHTGNIPTGNIGNTLTFNKK